MYFLNDTGANHEGATKWTAYRFREDAIDAAQDIIALRNFPGIWIDGGEIHVSEHARLDWSLRIYDNMAAALAAVQDYDEPGPEEHAIRTAARRVGDWYSPGKPTSSPGM